MKIRLASDVTKDSIVDGPGLRAVIWTQGCPHRCSGCHNPQTHNFDGGIEIEVKEVAEELSNLKLHRGVTFSGGEPLAQAEACVQIAKEVKKKDLDIWLYTGYTFEQIIKAANTYRPDWANLLKYIDVIVDGPYVQEKQNAFLKFRGSTNQRIIDVRKTLAYGKIIEHGDVETKVG